MKAHTDTRSRRIAREEYENVREEIFRSCANDIMVQTLSTVIWTLMTAQDWDGEKVKKFVEQLHDTDELMDNPSKLHHKFSGLECEQIIKEKCGVDLRAEFPARVEVKK